MIGGIIFDMDGVISDTQKLHAMVESRLLNRYGIDLSPEQITHTYAGVRTRDFFIELLNQQSLPYDINALLEEKWTTMATLAGGSVDPIPGSIALITRLHAMKLPLAVASASPITYVNAVLSSLGVMNYFNAIIGGDMVTRGKPDPESFLLAATKLHVPPKQCLVIEDGISGMEAARQGNMVCVGLVDNITDSYPTKHIIRSLHELTDLYLAQLTNESII